MSLRAADEWHVSAGVGQVLVPAAAGEFAAQVEILAMGLLEGGAEAWPSCRCCHLSSSICAAPDWAGPVARQYPPTPQAQGPDRDDDKREDRHDHADNDDHGIPAVRHASTVPSIRATCRREESGERLDGDLHAQVVARRAPAEQSIKPVAWR